MKKIGFIFILIFALFFISCTDLDLDHIFFPEYYAGICDQNDSQPYLVTNVDTSAKSIYVNGDYLYLASDPGTYDIASQYMQIINISDPYHIQSLGKIDTVCGNYFAQKGTVIYVAAITNFYVINAATPSAPVKSTSIGFSGNSQFYFKGAAVSGNYLYLPFSQYESGYTLSGFVVYSISTPLSPSLVVAVTNESLSNTITAVGAGANTLVLTVENRQPCYYDIRTPSAPVLAYQDWPSGTVSNDVLPDVRVYGEYAYLTYGSNAITILNIADPAQPAVVSHIPNPQNNTMPFYTVRVSGQYAIAIGDYVNADSTSFGKASFIYNISDIASPKEIIISPNLTFNGDFIMKNPYALTLEESYLRIYNLSYHIK